MKMSQMPGDSRTRKLKFWLFGIFVLAFAAVTAVMGAVGRGNIGAVFGQLNYWLIVAATAVLCVAAYFVLARMGKK
jgi:uncharacterized membrane protein YhaH (DUF805 family)